MHLQKQIDRLLTEQASQWLETLRTADARENAQFCEWLRQSRLHVEEFLEVVAIDQALQGVDANRNMDVRALIQQMSSTVVPMTPAAARTNATAANKRRRWSIALAASVAAVCVIAGGLYLRFTASNAVVITAAGEQRTMTLDDGSVVILNGDSRLRLAYSKQERNLELQVGEAVFRVARDATRPFQVHTPTAVVRAVGTQFNVSQQAQGTVVSVMEGRVRILTAAQSATQDLSAGEEAQIAASGHIQKKAHPDVARAVAWQRKSLRVEEAPLEQIVAEINRHSAVKLRLEGIAPGTRRYGGIFDGNDPESLAAVLERESDLIVERRAGEIVIRQAHPVR